MILVLCEETDQSALWAAEAMRLRGKALAVVTGADLAMAERWEHTVGAAGADCELRLAGGARLRGRDVAAVFNRLAFVPSAWQRRFHSPDRDYALLEMHAFYLSWLHALPGPKLNAPTPQGLCGNQRHPSAWTALAARAGLPVRPFRQTSDDDPAVIWQTAGSNKTSWQGANSQATNWQARPQPTANTHATLHVIGDRVIGPGALAARHGAACRRLAQIAGVMLLGIDFAPAADGSWQMTAASLLPDLISGGEALADALTAALSP
jgi:hypothetical protein